MIHAPPKYLQDTHRRRQRTENTEHRHEHRKKTKTCTACAQNGIYKEGKRAVSGTHAAFSRALKKTKESNHSISKSRFSSRLASAASS